MSAHRPFLAHNSRSLLLICSDIFILHSHRARHLPGAVDEDEQDSVSFGSSKRGWKVSNVMSLTRGRLLQEQKSLEMWKEVGGGAVIWTAS